MKAAFRALPGDAWALFARAPAVRLACVSGDGRPILRTVHGVITGDAIAFHGGDHGDKLSLIDREVVASVEEIVAEIPSYFIDPEFACPATTYYLSAFAHGVVRRVRDLGRKAHIVQALMDRYQPEGGYTPIDVNDPRYAQPLEQLLVAELLPERLSAKHKLGQNRKRSAMERVLACLWRRGGPGDLRAIRMIKEAHPAGLDPEFLRGPRGVHFCCAPDDNDARCAAEMLAAQYWNEGVAPRAIERAHTGSIAWVVARQGDGDGELVATARANGDGARHAYILDAFVSPRWRGKGVGKALMALLLDHPQVRDCEMVQLTTRDAQPFYAHLGFADHPGQYTQLTLRRDATPKAARSTVCA